MTEGRGANSKSKSHSGSPDGAAAENLVPDCKNRRLRRLRQEKVELPLYEKQKMRYDR